MLESLPFGKRKLLTLKRVSRQLRGLHCIVQSIALSTRNFITIHRLSFPHANVYCFNLMSSKNGRRSTFELGAYRMIFIETISGDQEIVIVVEH